MRQILNDNLADLLEQARDNDRAYCDAESRFYAATARLEKLDPSLFRELDNSWVAVFLHLQRVAWHCGRNSALLVMGPADGGGHDNR